MTLPNGVQIKDFKVGSGDDSITSTSSKVSIQCSGPLLFYMKRDGINPECAKLPSRHDLGVTRPIILVVLSSLITV